MKMIALIFVAAAGVMCTVDEGQKGSPNPKEISPHELRASIPALGYNLFATANADLWDSSTQGPVAILGSAKLKDFAIGLVMPEDEARCDLSVKHNLNFTRGSVFQGRICVEGKFVSEELGTKFLGSDVLPVEIGSYGKSTTDIANRFASMQSFQSFNAVALNAKKTYLKLDATTQEGLVSFRLRNDTNPLIEGIDILGSDKVSIVLNLYGDSWDLSKIGINLRGIKETNVLYNFPDAKILVLNDMTILGSIIAPKASVTFLRSSIVGSMFCSAIVSDSRFVLKPYTGITPN